MDSSLKIKLKEIGLFPSEKKCHKCGSMLSSSFVADSSLYFYCLPCNSLTEWNKDTSLSRMNISLSELEILLQLFVDNHPVTTACRIMNSTYLAYSLSQKTISRYFKLFSQIALKFYKVAHESIMLEGVVEIDETQLYKEKLSKAPGRPYEYSDIWLIGFKERHSKRFLIFPSEIRSADVFIPILLAHVKVQSRIYTDSFSVYVNNRKTIPESKLEQWNYIHKFVNHSITFVNEIFEDTHTNNIERLWRTVKEHIRKHKTRSLYMLCIGRFYFHKSLERNAQLRYLAKAIHENNFSEEDIDV